MPIKIFSMQTRLYALLLMPALLMMLSCSSTEQILKDVLETGSSTKPTESEVASGLKEALTKGITTGAQMVSQKDGYFKNPAIKILFPPEAKKVENTLRDIGAGALCDKVIRSLNRAAEDAAKEAKLIFVSAIRQMTINDAMDILFGADDAATQYLRRTTSAQLQRKFQPVIQQSLDKVQATKYWNDAFTRYNKIPLVQKINPDLDEYVTLEAIDGLFHMVAKEERKIRENPLERTTALLKKVFGYYDSKQ